MSQVEVSDPTSVTEVHLQQCCPDDKGGVFKRYEERFAVEVVFGHVEFKAGK